MLINATRQNAVNAESCYINCSYVQFMQSEIIQNTEYRVTMLGAIIQAAIKNNAVILSVVVASF